MDPPPNSRRVPTLLGLFAKHWAPGKVKTRLARTIGESHAAMLHALFVATLLERLDGAAEVRVIAFEPPESMPAFAAAARSRFELWPQTAGDLGQRMQAFFAQALAVAERVVLIGSDSPDLPAGYLTQAFDALAEHDVVLGPSVDGGYYLLGIVCRGANGRLPPIFTGIDWSTADVWSQTTSRLRAAGIAWHELPPWYDVDEMPDLESLRKRLAAAVGTDPALARLRIQLDALFARRLG